MPYPFCRTVKVMLLFCWHKIGIITAHTWFYNSTNLLRPVALTANCEAFYSYEKLCAQLTENEFLHKRNSGATKHNVVLSSSKILGWRVPLSIPWSTPMLVEHKHLQWPILYSEMPSAERNEIETKRQQDSFKTVSKLCQPKQNAKSRETF